MSSKLLTGFIVAAAVALSLSDVSIAGIAAWKVVLALAGFALFAAGGRWAR